MSNISIIAFALIMCSCVTAEKSSSAFTKSDEFSKVGSGNSAAFATVPALTAAFHTFKTMWLGPNKCLTASDADSNIVRMRDCDRLNEGQKLASIATNRAGYFKIVAQITGTPRCLDIINDGVNNRYTQMAACGDYSGQFWKIESSESGYARLTTLWRGEAMCLDIVNDGTNDIPQLAACGNYSGQLWMIR